MTKGYNMKPKAMLIYFDLRRYAVIEKTMDQEKVISILSNMHSIIEDKMLAINAILYHIQTDTAVFLIKEYESKKTGDTLLEIKTIIDTSMINMGLPSRLMICAVFEEYSSGYIKTNHINHYNVFGTLMNTFQKQLYLIESSEDPIVSEGIVVAPEALPYLNIDKKVTKVNLQGNELLVL